jgi:tRNA threonylcarbamoyladenosine modification (KEOPS) complex  Pcc1 subunit
MFDLEVTIDLPLHAARICAESIQMEAQSEALSRSKIDLSCREDALIFRVAASDLSSMRAAMNTYLRWINMCASLIDKNKNTKNGSTDV